MNHDAWPEIAWRRREKSTFVQPHTCHSSHMGKHRSSYSNPSATYTKTFESKRKTWLSGNPLNSSFSTTSLLSLNLAGMSRLDDPDVTVQPKESIEARDLMANADFADIERVWRKFEVFKSDLQQHWEYAERERLLPLNLPSSKLIFQGPGSPNFFSPSTGNCGVQQMLLLIAKKEKHAGTVICLLEDIFERILDDLLNEKEELVFYLKSRKRSGKGTLDVESGAVGDSTDSEDRAIRFPGKTVRETWKFCKQIM
jgi:hypothetical protein